MAQIVLENISKQFRVWVRPQGRFSVLRGALHREKKLVQALQDISFQIEPGELVGYIGPNGAGKSTTVKVMSGILTPDSGNCRILGRVPWEERVAHVAQLGVVFGQRSQLWWEIPVSDSFELLREVYRIEPEQYRRRLNRMTEVLEVGGLLKTPVRQLSLGQRMRCELVAALLHSPQIVFLDEPTIGLDAVSKLAMREFLLQENRERGTTMILTTHDMDDIEALTSRVMVIGRGSLLYDGTLEQLKRTYMPLRCIKAVVPQEVAPMEIPGAREVQTEGTHWSIWFDPQEMPAHKMIAAVGERLPLDDLTVEDTDVEQMVARMYREMQL